MCYECGCVGVLGVGVGISPLEHLLSLQCMASAGDISVGCTHTL